MPHSTNLLHSVPFYGVVTGLALSDFTIDVFTVDSNPVDSGTLSSLVIQDLGGGYYQASYTPTVVGFYYLALNNAAHSVRVLDGVDIDDGEAFFNLTQDTPTSGALRPASDGDSLTEFLLMVIQSSDWQVGRTSTRYAVAMTQLDSDGNWLATPLTIQHGTYHIVIMNNFGKIRVIQPFLVV